jgi:acetyltransferase-like isoleucine patch superfamily enzyme
VYGKVFVLGDGEVHVGDGVLFDGRNAPIEIHAKGGATLRIGARVRILGGVLIEAFEQIEIGDDTTFDEFSVARDNNAHRISDRRGKAPPSVPLTLGKSCYVGRRAIVLPGASLGDGASVQPGTVVSRSVPSGMTIGGSPPRTF